MLQFVRFRMYPICINLAGRIFSFSRNIADVRKEFVWSLRIMTAGESWYVIPTNVRQQTGPDEFHHFQSANALIDFKKTASERENIRDLS